MNSLSTMTKAELIEYIKRGQEAERKLRYAGVTSRLDAFVLQRSANELTEALAGVSKASICLAGAFRGFHESCARLREVEEKYGADARAAVAAFADAPSQEDPEATRIEDATYEGVRISVRASAVLRGAGVTTLGELHKLRLIDLRMQKNCGRKTAREIEELALAKGVDIRRSACGNDRSGGVS